jgi:hypothetical protein
MEPPGIGAAAAIIVNPASMQTEASAARHQQIKAAQLRQIALRRFSQWALQLLVQISTMSQMQPSTKH